MNVGIIGHEAAKFTLATEQEARAVIRGILDHEGTEDVLVSGGCHLGGIDIWAEEEADRLGLRKIIHLPKSRSWENGYKQRNMQIAQDSDVVHVVVVRTLPESYKGMRFPLCYHCKTKSHIKSGGCWTAKYAETLGRPARWHEVGAISEDQTP